MPSMHDLVLAVAIPVDSRLIAAVLVAGVAGLVRGFSGFGSALVYVPLLSAIYGPQVAVATLVLIDVTCGSWLAVKALREWEWREVALIGCGAIIGIPIGTMTLVYASNDVAFLRVLMAIFVLAATSLILAGWRYPAEKPGVTMSAGIIAGFFGGAFQMDGPPAVIFWLGTRKGPATVRANIVIFLEASGFLICLAYGFAGLLSHEVLKLSFWLFWPFLLFTIVGAFRFRNSSEEGYRRVAFALIYLAAITSLPFFDGWLHWALSTL